MLNERVAYLILHLGAPAPGNPDRDQIESQLQELSKAVGGAVRIMDFDSSQTFPHSPRFVLVFPNQHRQDDLAQKLAESILYAAGVFCVPVGDSAEPASMVILPSDFIDGTRQPTIQDVIELEHSRTGPDRMAEYPGTSIGSVIHHTAYRVGVALAAARALFQEDHLREAARYLSSSHQEFHVFPGQMSEVMNDPDTAPSTGWERSSVETALINAFKAVEAIVGEPPSDTRKFAQKLKVAGLDPNEPFGYPDKHPLIEFIYQMQDARDKSSAHGGTPNTPVKIRDMVLYQDCSEYVFVKAIEKILGEDLY